MIAQLEALKVRLTTQAASLVFVCAAAVLLLTTPSIWSAVVEPVETTHFYRDYPLFAVVGAALVLSCLSPGSAAARLFASSPMRLLGRVSFSGYLMHPLALHLTSHLAATIGKLPSMLVSALTVAALTVALYYAAERPLISLKKAAAA